MQINYYGNSCFSIKDGDFNIVMDPYDEGTGLNLPRLKANVVTGSSHQPYRHNMEAIEGDPKVFDWPGEYETSSIHFQGIASFHNAKDDQEQKENTIFKMEFKGVRLCHLGELGTKLTPEQTEEAGDVDVLFVPVGGAMDAKKTKEIIEQIEPRVIIPMLYNTEGSTRKLGELEPFLAEMGAQNAESVDAFIFKKSELPEDTSKVVVIGQTQ